jgi:hypothetical protein
MTLDQCASACVQLIFQSLSSQDKLVFGRCNKRLIHERNAKHSWKIVRSDCLQVSSDQLGIHRVGAFSNSCLIYQTSTPISLILGGPIPQQVQDGLQSAQVKEIHSNYSWPRWEYMHLDDSSTDFLSKKISQTVCLLNLFKIRSSQAQLVKIAQACYSSSTLTSLVLKYDYKWDEDVAHCIFDLISRGQLTEVDFAGFHNKKISSEWFQKLCEAIRNNKKLTKFCFNGFHLGGEKCNILLDALLACPDMKSLELSLNALDDRSVSKTCTLEQLEHLDISLNAVSDVGMAEICKVITRPGNRLHFLHVRRNDNLVEAGALALADAMESEHCNLTYVDICGIDWDQPHHPIIGRLKEITKRKGIELSSF